jgi:uncharacterized protein (TIGR02145 family)
MKHIYLVIFILLFCSLNYAQQPCPGIATVNYGGQIYNTVAIGSQCWLKENLDVGIMIDSLANPSNNGIIEKYCYGNKPANCTIYGGLYQWNEAMQYVTTEGTTGICPTGWHIPTYAELQTLATTVSNDGKALQAVGQGDGTNTSGFSALLAGNRFSYGLFDYLGVVTLFWSSTEYDTAKAGSMTLDGNIIYFGSLYKEGGYSVRCLNNNTVGIDDKDKSDIPKEFLLLQNYPNPFNPSTVISYSLPSVSNVKLNVYNTLGQTVRVLESGYKNAGTYTVTFDASEFTSGIYFYKLEAGQFTQVKKMMLIK